MIKLPGKIALDLLFLPVLSVLQTEVCSLGIDGARLHPGAVVRVWLGVEDDAPR